MKRASRICSCAIVPAGALGVLALIGCAGGRQPPTLTAFDSERAGSVEAMETFDPDEIDVHIPDQAEADALAAEQITEANADEVFERLRREILAEWAAGSSHDP